MFPKKLNPISLLLVAVQLACLSIIYLTGPLICIRVDLQIWQLSGLFLAISGLISLGRKSFSVLPEPKSKGVFVRKGIYAFIRHPMYAGIILVCICLVWQFPSPLRWGSFVVLLLVLVVKINREEAYLTERYEEYPEYQRQTNRLIPFIW